MSVEKYKEYYEILKHNPATYIEELYGIKLLSFQKAFLNTMCKEKHISYIRNPFYKYQKYLSLCFAAYINMKDNAKIVISSPDMNKVMNKEEFGKWLVNEYWRDR